MIIPFEIVYIFLSTVYMKLRNLGHVLKKNIAVMVNTFVFFANANK
jgi:hypothetical protein